MRASSVFALACLVLLSACSSRPVTTTDAGNEDGGPPADGGPRACDVDSDCDDGVACSVEICAEGVCRWHLDHASCADDVFCDGAERCDPVDGCIEGRRESCDDGDVCTVDRCVESEASCTHAARDLDDDGDVDMFCDGGNDCDDADPTVSSGTDERCGNRRDDDCDGDVDEDACATAPHDTCDDPLDVSAGGSFVIEARELRGDYLGCGILECRDFVARFTIDEAQDVEIIAADPGDDWAYTEVALRRGCDDATTEIDDVTGFPATLRYRALEPGTYFVLAGAERNFGSGATDQLTLDVTFSPDTTPPTNETCASALDVGAGGTFTADFIDTRDDLALECGEDDWPELVYAITTSARADLRVTLDGFARLGLSVRSACGDATSALGCVVLEPHEDRVRVFPDVPAGTHYFVLELRSIPEAIAQITIEALPAAP
ncbi:MopE-related protein [Sandaracinus amylolyticus]|uniref:MopE-related protein n=1 Tax=Sandaracinus amylolyticus TaxID=927083 RepID=UPI00069CD614|nr:MopE-related protein [Sandaracinus amylolyticus]